MSTYYLGDGLYARFDGFMIELFASDGIRKTNSVYLEPSVLENFYEWTQNGYPDYNTGKKFWEQS